MVDPTEKEDVDWGAFAETVKRNHRPHAGHFSWETDPSIAEEGALLEFQNALAAQGRLFFREAPYRGQGNDPPDCEAIGVGGHSDGIEITDMVDLRRPAAARESLHYDGIDSRETLITALHTVMVM